jgi:hypothetical protein
MHLDDLNKKPLYTDSGKAGALRFINRNGKRILQQEWLFIDFNARGIAVGGHEEWKDIPYIPGAEQGDMTVHP